MHNTRVVIVCDQDKAAVQEIQSALTKERHEVEVINDGTELIAKAIKFNPSVVIVNPDIHGFNEYDVCKKLMKERNIAIILLLDPHSVHRSRIDECEADDVVTKPVEMKNLLNLVVKNITVHQ